MKVITEGSERNLPALWFRDGRIFFIDQRMLPSKFELFEARETADVEFAIKHMVVRGAPAIGCAAAYGLAAAMLRKEDPEEAAGKLRATRPTANDLFYAIQWMLEMGPQLGPAEAADRYVSGIVDRCRRIGVNGNSVISDGDVLLTHCNAGALATVDYGTALAPMRFAHNGGKRIFVYVDETRPWLQGSRLTAWELTNESIPHAIIADNAAGHFLRKEVDAVIVGADRIASNGDFANKIGTYEKAVVAAANSVPFYVAAPLSTFDFGISSGDDIRIEERAPEEVTAIDGRSIAGPGESARNPVFDVTPAEFVTGFITEYGIFRPAELGKLRDEADKRGEAF
ncbi:MAG: S-methyl-5-thioribose-1-phosphate isomerase [Candidatus Thermoplasmatota archaeon]|jgi:translation initiation factor eIF-2B subunit alpha/methylthioribose-1-phosphate isomerase|nr:S-methyl-5-thioribose-1-phosphate isomerase [Candidatus Sysuiplasma jiujiangense]MCL5678423.1 S-methyl-5-thioribose-1-phosphate isomerase [Candidatus Thermoplasmatota archaeon]